MMLDVNQLIGFGAGGKLSPTSVSYITETGSSTNLTTYTFTSVNIGSTAADRILVIGLYGRSTTTAAKTVSSATVNGNSLSIVADMNSQYAHAVGIIRLASGTTATIEVTWSGAMASGAIAVWAVYGSESLSPYDSVSANSASSTIDIPAGGVCIASVWEDNSNATLVGVTEDFERTYDSGGAGTYMAGGSYTSAAGEVGRTLNVTGVSGFTLIGVSW